MQAQNDLMYIYTQMEIAIAESKGSPERIADAKNKVLLVRSSLAVIKHLTDDHSFMVQANKGLSMEQERLYKQVAELKQKVRTLELEIQFRTTPQQSLFNEQSPT